MKSLLSKQGTLAPGSDADVLIIDPQAETLISAVTHHSCADYSLYERRRVQGMPKS